MKKCGSLRRIGCRVCTFDKVVVLAVRVSGYVTLYVIILGTEVNTAAGEIIGETDSAPNASVVSIFISTAITSKSPFE